MGWLALLGPQVMKQCLQVRLQSVPVTWSQSVSR